MSAAKKHKCSHRDVTSALGREYEQTCLQRSSQRIVTPSLIMHRCPDHELEAGFVEAQGWTSWPIDD